MVTAAAKPAPSAIRLAGLKKAGSGFSTKAIPIKPKTIAIQCERWVLLRKKKKAKMGMNRTRVITSKLTSTNETYLRE